MATLVFPFSVFLYLKRYIFFRLFLELWKIIKQETEDSLIKSKYILEDLKYYFYLFKLKVFVFMIGRKKVWTLYFLSLPGKSGYCRWWKNTCWTTIVVNCSKIGDRSASAIVCLVLIGKREREKQWWWDEQREREGEGKEAADCEWKLVYMCLAVWLRLLFK